MTDINASQRHKLKAFVKKIGEYRGRHTELVSVYIPAGYDLNKIISHLSEEQGTATNIKSKGTRDNVIASLEKMIQHLRLYPKTPEHGLAVFAGNVAQREGQQDYKVWSLEPPTPLNQRLYRCDKEFVLDPLRKMAEDKNIYGLVVMDKREANIAFLKGKTIIPLTQSTSAVPGKSRAGGQSAQRFERLREGAAIEFYKRIAEHMKSNFLDRITELKGIIVGGPGRTKQDFVEGGYITDQIKQKIIALKDLSYTGEFGLQELLEKSEDVLASEDIMEEKRAMQAFFEKLSKQADLVAYGETQVMEALKMGAADTLLISESLEEKKIEEFEKQAEMMKTEVKIISTETREGTQLKDMGKVGAILRYKIE
ncbi:peptide chain release factor 1 [Candidatus Woesearchaeota archaeon]|nr:peptide chain release factor 1 [Candidatus Woesearchaeota archaeon]